MKRFLVATILTMATYVVSAQSSVPAAPATSAEATTTVVSQPKTDKLALFNSVKIDGQMSVVLKRVSTLQEMRITYDTKGNPASKFKFDIDKKGVLTGSEKNDPKHTIDTDVIIYYHSLRDIRIAHAKVTFEGVLESDLLDLVVSSGAIALLEVKSLDVAVECTGTSCLALNGSTKYLTMRASTAKLDCSKLSVVSATIDASHSAEVRLAVEERLEVTTSTGARLIYKGMPAIVRNHNAIFGGEIININ